MDTTPNLSLPYIAPAQAQKHVTHNEALRMLDAIVHLAVLDRDLVTPPATPSDGDRYLVPDAASGAWAGQAGKIAAWQDGAWAILAPHAGWLVWLLDEARLLAWNGSSWIDGIQGAVNPVPMVGVNTTADTTSRLAVASAASLLTNVGAGHQLKINKASPSDTASVLLQTGYSGRAEIATAGDDDLHLKVSPDGTTWHEAMVVDRASGAVTFARGATRTEIATFTASGSWTRPAWAKLIEVVLVGGGGGGGSGRRGIAGTTRSGGGGGSAGALVRATFLATELPLSATIDIGAGGAGGLGASSDDTDGNSGSSGTNTTFADGGSVLLVASGGVGGGGGSTSNGVAGASVIGTSGPSNPGGVGTSGTVANAPLTGAIEGPGGGGGGGNLTIANGVANPGDGSSGYRAGASSREAVGGIRPTALNSPGQSGADKAWTRGAGGGGSGSKGSLTANGPAGGNGGNPGGGGGGGCGSLNGFVSGPGGNGGRGEAWIVAIG